jgi:membrane peptidoglycan carboxypeptidase
METQHIAFEDKLNAYTGYVVYAQKVKHKQTPIGVVNLHGEYQAHIRLDNIPTNLIDVLITIEDKSFFSHFGIDIKAICRAVFINIQRLRISQGGSTLSQQLARNLLRDNHRSIIRKLKETYLAISLEHLCTKEDILESYLNEVFWGKKCYGIRAASLIYFSKEPWCLSKNEIIFLVAILKGPNLYLTHKHLCTHRVQILQNVLKKSQTFNTKHLQENNQSESLNNNSMKMIFGNECIKHLALAIDKNKFIVKTTLSYKIQKFITNYFEKSDLPISVLIMKNNKIIGVYSKYGIDYPFTYKSNVGSTLKPFIYCFLRQNGIQARDEFSTSFSVGDIWKVREVTKMTQRQMTLEDALLNSNNSVFLSAVSKVGFSKTLVFLSHLLKKDISDLDPSSILGSTHSGISLFELTQIYYQRFCTSKSDRITKECIDILRKNCAHRFKLVNTKLFLKTGTTNKNKDKFAFLGYGDLLFAFLCHDSTYILNHKEGYFLNSIRSIILELSKKVYKVRF